MDQIDYVQIYALQDRVLAAVYSVESSFYLTGGTCLNRFYLEKRYSDDLDLFTNDAPMFRSDVRAVASAINGAGLSHKTLVDTRDFVRLSVDETLQVDFVNDRLPHVGRQSTVSKGIRIDSVENIAANKITAVLGRDEPKDVFDLFLTERIAKLDWPNVIEGARQKAVLDLDELERRLRAFPVELLDALPVSDEEFLNEMKSHYGEFR